MRKVTLLLSDGTRFHGESFGYEAPVAGEVVFNTAMTGYPESLTDPSYAGQLMVLTYPLVGNYGVPPFTFEENGLATFMESDRIHARAIIVTTTARTIRIGMRKKVWLNGCNAKKCLALPASIRVNSPKCSVNTG